MPECSNPGCHEDAQYEEPVSDEKEDVTENDSFPVCHKHVDPTQDGITRL